MAPRKVLIIDDEAELREMLSIAFASQNYKIFTAKDGEEGLKLAASKKPDIIILDIKMPRLNGYEFLNQLRKTDKISAIPVVVLTSLTEETDKSDEEWARSLEVEDFASKPIEPFELLESVERILTSRCNQ